MIRHTVLLSLVFISIAKAEDQSQNIESSLSAYFGSKQVKNFYDLWQKSRKSFETGVAKFLKETYAPASGGMNVYVKQENNPQDLIDGFYLTDNIVHLLFTNLFLRQIPHFLDPDVSLSLTNNVIRVETKLCKTFIDAVYMLMRNRSDILYDAKHDPFSNSPFVLQQVHTNGIVTVIAEDCHAIGHAVVTLTGETPHIGLTNFKVVNCKFSIEIFQPGLPSPPVITPYFSKQQRDQLQALLSEPLNSELAVKLEGIVVSLLNTTAIFGQEYLQFRSAQRNIFRETKKYMSQLVRKLNKLSIQVNQGVVALPDLLLRWDDGVTRDDEKDSTEVRIASVTMNGLDVAYASLRGGPIKMASTLIEDEIRFYRLQVRGKLTFENSTTKAVYDFAAELLDVPVSIQINVDIGEKGNKASKKQLQEIEVRKWRQLIFTTGNFKNVLLKEIPGDSLVCGYLLQEVPNAVTRHLMNSVLKKAINTDGELSSKNNAILRDSKDKKKNATDS